MFFVFIFTEEVHRDSRYVPAVKKTTIVRNKSVLGEMEHTRCVGGGGSAGDEKEATSVRSRSRPRLHV